MCLQGKDFRVGQETFYPIIPIKTPRNRLIHSKNRKFHPSTQTAGISAEKFTGETDNLLISLDLMSPWVRIKVWRHKIHSPGGATPWRHKLTYLFPGNKSTVFPILTVSGSFSTPWPTQTLSTLLKRCVRTGATTIRWRRCGGRLWRA